MIMKKLKICRCSQSICHQLSLFHCTTYFPKIDSFYLLFLTHNPFCIQHQHSITIEKKRKSSYSFFFPLHKRTSWKHTWNFVNCIHALVHPKPINNRKIEKKKRKRDFSCSLDEHYNDDSIFLTHTWHRFSLFDQIRCIAQSFAVIINCRLYEHRDIDIQWRMNKKKIDAKKKKPRRSFSLVAPTKSSCMRMMLINEDNERIYLVRTRIPLRRESITEKEKIHLDTLISLFYVFIAMIHL